MSRFYIENGEILDCGFFLGSKEQYVDIMNKQDQRIVELEEQLAKEQKHISRLKNMNKSHDETVGRLTEENNQLKYQLEEKDKEIERLKDFIGCKGCINVIKKSNEDQKQLAIAELEKVNEILTDTIIEVTQNEFDLNKLCYLEEISAKFHEKMQEQIKELKGEKNDNR